MLHLTSSSLRQIRDKLEHGPQRTAAISVISGSVGLIAGKLEDARVTPLAAIGAGTALQLAGFHTLGDGAMAGGAAILGYRLGAKRKKSAPTAQVIPGNPRVTRHRPVIARR